MKLIDIHSHILPYMDDGAKDMDMTFEMLRIARADGITDIIATPHYKAGRFKGDAMRAGELLEELRSLMKEENIDMNLYLGNEIYYRSELEEKLVSGALSTLNGSGYVLVEFSPLDDFVHIRNAMEDILGMGYVPVLAHAERYQCMTKRPEHVRELKEMGCDIQVNADSVTGETGFKVKWFVHKLLKEYLVDYIGTDAHGTDKRKPAMKKCAELLYRKYDKAYADALLFRNAQKRLLSIKNKKQEENENAEHR